MERKHALRIGVLTIMLVWGLAAQIIEARQNKERQAIINERAALVSSIMRDPKLRNELDDVARNNPVTTCQVRYIDGGRDAEIGACIAYIHYGALARKVSSPELAEKLISINTIDQSMNNTDFVLVDGVTEREIFWSELNIKKFLDDEELFARHLDAQNKNLENLLTSSKSEAYTAKKLVEALPDKRITDANELLLVLRTLELIPPLMPLYLSELRENFSVISRHPGYILNTWDIN